MTIYCTWETGCPRHPPTTDREIGLMRPWWPSFYASVYGTREEKDAATAELSERRRAWNEDKVERPDRDCIILGEIDSGTRACVTCFHFDRVYEMWKTMGGPFGPVPTGRATCRRFPAAVAKATADYCAEWKGLP